MRVHLHRDLVQSLISFREIGRFSFNVSLAYVRCPLLTLRQLVNIVG